MRRVFAWFVLTRVLLFLVAAAPWGAPRCDAYSVKDERGVRRDVEIAWLTPKDVKPPAQFDAGAPWLDGFARWDAHFYLEIAAFGYGALEDGRPPTRAGYLPLYPLAVRAVACALHAANGGGWTVPLESPRLGIAAAVIVSNACLLAAALALFRLTRAMYDAATAERAVVVLAAGPFAFFGAACLSEAAFLWLSIEAFAALRSRRPITSGVFAGAAAATRFVGALLALPLVYDVLRSPDYAGRRASAAVKVLTPLLIGVAATPVWHHLAWGRAGAYFEIQASLGHERFPTLAGIATLVDFGSKDAVERVRDAVQLFAAAAASVACLRLRGAPLLWCAIALAAPLLSDDVISLPRYLFAAFPVMVGLARLPIGRPATLVITILSLAAQTVGFSFFSRHWPVMI